jgi:hypothetical protein
MAKPYIPVPFQLCDEKTNAVYIQLQGYKLPVKAQEMVQWYFDGTMEIVSDQNMKISLVGNGQIQGFSLLSPHMSTVRLHGRVGRLHGM